MSFDFYLSTCFNFCTYPTSEICWTTKFVWPRFFFKRAKPKQLGTLPISALKTSSLWRLGSKEVGSLGKNVCAWNLCVIQFVFTLSYTLHWVCLFPAVACSWPSRQHFPPDRSVNDYMRVGSGTGYQWQQEWVELTLLLFFFLNPLKGSLIKVRQNAAGFHFGMKSNTTSPCKGHNFHMKISWNKSM